MTDTVPGPSISETDPEALQDSELAAVVNTKINGVEALLARGDSKAQTLSTNYAVLLTLTVFIAALNPAAGWPMKWALMLICTALALTLWVVRGRLGRRTGTGLLSWAHQSVDDTLRQLRNEIRGDCTVLGAQLKRLATIAVVKFWLTNISVALVLAALLLLMWSALTATGTAPAPRLPSGIQAGTSSTPAPLNTIPHSTHA